RNQPDSRRDQESGLDADRRRRESGRPEGRLVITEGLILITAQAADPEVNEVWSGWGSVLFTLVVLTLVTFAICFGIWQYLKTRRATLESRADIAREEAYRRLAEEATSVQNRTAAELHQ